MTATDLSTGRAYQAVADARGEYSIVNLTPGSYKVQAELTGFATVVNPSVEFLVGQNVTLPFVLKLASVEETVTVSGQAPLVDTRSSAVSGNVDRRQMESMPLQGRNWLELSLLVKGVTTNNVTVASQPVASEYQFQINLDGQQVTQKIGGGTYGSQGKVSRDAIAEFQIVTNLFDITQGRSVGIQVQAITKAGTNTLSGSTYGYFRDDKLNAADFVAKVVLPYQNQQLGGSLGGPIRHHPLILVYPAAPGCHGRATDAHPAAAADWRRRSGPSRPEGCSTLGTIGETIEIAVLTPGARDHEHLRGGGRDLLPWARSRPFQIRQRRPRAAAATLALGQPLAPWRANVAHDRR